MCSTAVSMLDHFADLPDPRTGPAVLHRVLDIVVIAVCAVLCGANDWVAVEHFGLSKYAWFKGFLELPHGIPAHDTFWRFFAVLDPQAFERCFVSWVQVVAQTVRGEVIAIDGKSACHSYEEQESRLGVLHLVSAWACENRLVLGQVAVEDKSNEITAIPTILHGLDLSGCIVTIDAMGCQKAIAKQIVEQEGDYVLALKENQPQLHEGVEALIRYAQSQEGRTIPQDRAQTVEKDHGRVEKRCAYALDVGQWGFYLNPKQVWPGLRSVVQVTRQCGGQETPEVRYYISSLPCDSARLLQVARAHWGVENRLHWILDIAFREDDSRIRKGHGQHNFSLLRRLALNLLHHETTVAAGIQNKRLRAGWDQDYLLKVLGA